MDTDQQFSHAKVAEAAKGREEKDYFGMKSKIKNRTLEAKKYE